MDVMVSSTWRSGSVSAASPPHAVRSVSESSLDEPEPFVFRHGRFEVRLARERDGLVIQYSSSGRLFGPREIIYRERHIEARHAAWDFMCRVIRCTDDEDTGLTQGRLALAWLQENA